MFLARTSMSFFQDAYDAPRILEQKNRGQSAKRQYFREGITEQRVARMYYLGMCNKRENPINSTSKTD